MSDGAKQLYDSLSQYSDLEELITIGEAEGLYLECKAPAAPQLSRDLRNTLAKALAGFSNTAGGVILWGISTTKHEHSGLDVLSQIEPIGSCRLLARQINKAIPTLTTPPITTTETKIITKSKTDTRGVIITYIPKALGDPVQSNSDNIFYFRSGDDFSVAPYEMVKRLFAATEVPDLHPQFNDPAATLGVNGLWEIPITVENESSAIAENVNISITIDNPSACEIIRVSHFKDQSAFNSGERVFMVTLPGVVHRGLGLVVGTLQIKMKVGKRPKRLLKLTITLYANKMRARSINATIQLTKKGLTIVAVEERYLY